MQKVFRITVGIAAYNSEKNIKKLIESVLSQEIKSFTLEEVLVHSDKSADKTIDQIKKIRSNKLVIIDGSERKGFTGSVKLILQRSKGDVLVLLNDDIEIDDKSFLEKIVSKIKASSNVGLLSVDMFPKKPRTFIEKAAITGFTPFRDLGLSLRNGDNIFTCDGKVLVLTKKFKEKLIFPERLELTGNLDKFIYLSCISCNLKYHFVKETIIHFRLPSTMADFAKWQERNFASKSLVEKMFGNLSKTEYMYPKKKFLYFKLKAFLNNPSGGIVILLLGMYSKLFADFSKKKFQATWDLVQTSKQI